MSNIPTRDNGPLQVRYVDLTLERLEHTDSIMTMGALCARALREEGQITLYMTRDNKVEQALPGEVEVDIYAENDALRILIAMGYQDAQLVAYLRGREDRARRRAASTRPLEYRSSASEVEPTSTPSK